MSGDSTNHSAPSLIEVPAMPNPCTEKAKVVDEIIKKLEDADPVQPVLIPPARK